VPVRRPAFHVGSRALLPGSRGALHRGSPAVLRDELGAGQGYGATTTLP